MKFRKLLEHILKLIFHQIRKQKKKFADNTTQTIFFKNKPVCNSNNEVQK